MTKEAYFEELQEIVEDQVYLTESPDDLTREIRKNMWVISLHQSLAASISPQEMKVFLGQVKQSRQAQLLESGLVIDLIYYLWFDEPAGQLRLNFINYHHKEFPFKAQIELVETEVEIVASFLDSVAQGEMALDTLKEDSHTPAREYTLKVYSEVIKRHKHSS